MTPTIGPTFIARLRCAGGGSGSHKRRISRRTGIENYQPWRSPHQVSFSEVVCTTVEVRSRARRPSASSTLLGICGFLFYVSAGLMLEARRKSMQPLGERRKGCGDRRGSTRRSVGRHTGELWIMAPMVTDLSEAETSSLSPSKSSLSPSNWTSGSPASWQKCRLRTTVEFSSSPCITCSTACVSGR